MREKLTVRVMLWIIINKNREQMIRVHLKIYLGEIVKVIHT